MALNEKVIGLIAGQGRLPFLTAKGVRDAGLKVVCVGLDGNAAAVAPVALKVHDGIAERRVHVAGVLKIVENPPRLFAVWLV